MQLLWASGNQSGAGLCEVGMALIGITSHLQTGLSLQDESNHIVKLSFNFVYHHQSCGEHLKGKASDVHSVCQRFQLSTQRSNSKKSVSLFLY